jgi:drug/metabolite transporter (DMT)-like permease
MKAQTTNNYLGIIFALLAFLSFSIMNAVNRFALTKELMDFVYYFAFIKLFAFLLMLLFGVIIFGKGYFNVNHKKIVAIRSIILVANTIATTLAVFYLPLDIFYSIVFIMPILATLMGMVFLNEKFELIKFMAIIVGFIGVFIAINPAFKAQTEVIGIILAFIAAITGVTSGIIARKYLQAENTLSITFYPMALAFIVGMFMSYSDFSQKSLVVSEYLVFFIIILAAVAQVLGSLFYVKAYQIAQAKYVAPMQYTQMIWGIILGFLLFADVPALSTIIGSGIIVLSSLLIIHRSK